MNIFLPTNGKIRYSLAIIYLLILSYILSLIYITSLHTNPPRFKPIVSTPHSKPGVAIFESYIIEQLVNSAHSATFTVLDNGELLAFWFAGSYEGHPDVKIWSARFSQDHWSEARVAVSPQGLSNQLLQYIHKVGNPLVYRAINGVLHLFVVSVGAIGGWSESNIIHLQSFDNGVHWSRARKLIVTPLLNISTLTRTNAIALEDGGFYLPVYHEMLYTYPELLRFDAAGNFIQKIRMSSKKGMLQPAVVATSASSGYAFLRNKHYSDIVLYMQYGNGLYWGTPRATNISNMDSSLAVIVLDDGRLLMVHNPLERSELVLSVSNDGLTWIDVALLENTPGMEYSYPAIQIHDGLIDILYTYERKKIKHVRFNQAWLDKQQMRLLQQMPLKRRGAK